MASLNQSQLLRLQQKLSPQQIQMIKLLELPTLQLEQRIKQEVEENPALEEFESSEKSQDEALPKELTVEQYIDEQDSTPKYRSKISNFSKDDQQRELFLTDSPSLHEYLERQLAYKNLSDQDLPLATYLIQSIDDEGYLRRDLESVCDDIAFSLGIETTVGELERLLKVIQQLEPAGVGARTIQESLILQLDAHSDDSKTYRIAHKIINSYFDGFSKKHYKKLIARLGVEPEEFSEAIEMIVRLSPRPGNLYAASLNEVVPYLIPDFILEYHDGQFELNLNSYNIPEVKINRQYVEMIRSMSGDQKSDNSPEDKEEVVQFIKNKIESAKWFISAIKQRHNTLMVTMKEILEYQREFFVDGDHCKLRPMILKDIADRTGFDVSTISRVVNSKYVQTHFGIFLLKELFSEAMTTDSGDEVSSLEIKNILTQCISNEDTQKPLTDEELMDILNAKGYHIARRTVAKYRTKLDIPVARLRKTV